MKALYEKLLNEIPDYKTFLTLEELDASSEALAKAHPESVELFTLGHTVKGREIKCLKIGDHGKSAIMFGCPHPNEPIGSMMLEYFSEKLAESRELRDGLGYTWYIVKAWDADGLALNEKWLKGPYDIYTYTRNFFRPASAKQVDWTYPVDHGDFQFHDTLPETRAMMELIDRVKPAFIYSLHNAGLGGAYWYMTREAPELYDGFHAAAAEAGIPLSRSGPELPVCEEYSPAIFSNPSITAGYDFFRAAGVEHPEKLIAFGDSSAGYAAKYGTFTMLAELPYFFDRRIDDLTRGSLTLRDAAAASFRHSREKSLFMRGLLNEVGHLIDPDDVFYTAIHDFSDESGTIEANMAAIDADRTLDRPATVAEEFDALYVKRFYGLIEYGMAIRMLENALGTDGCDGKKREILLSAFYRAVEEHRRVTYELERGLDYSAVPIKKLIYVQLKSGLLAAEYAAK